MQRRINRINRHTGRSSSALGSALPGSRQSPARPDATLSNHLLSRGCLEFGTISPCVGGDFNGGTAFTGGSGLAFTGNDSAQELPAFKLLGGGPVNGTRTACETVTEEPFAGARSKLVGVSGTLLCTAWASVGNFLPKASVLNCHTRHSNQLPRSPSSGISIHHRFWPCEEFANLQLVRITILIIATGKLHEMNFHSAHGCTGDEPASISETLQRE